MLSFYLVGCAAAVHSEQRHNQCDGRNRANPEEKQRASQQQSVSRKCRTHERPDNRHGEQQRYAGGCRSPLGPREQPEPALQLVQILCQACNRIHAAPSTAYATSLPACSRCRFPTTVSAIASIASNASTHHQSSEVCSLLPADAADVPEPDPTPVFFHRFTVSGVSCVKSDSRRSGLTAAISSRPLARRISKKPCVGNWKVVALADSESESTRLLSGPIISTGTFCSLTVLRSTYDPTQ